MVQQGTAVRVLILLKQPQVPIKLTSAKVEVIHGSQPWRDPEFGRKIVRVDQDCLSYDAVLFPFLSNTHWDTRGDRDKLPDDTAEREKKKWGKKTRQVSCSTERGRKNTVFFTINH